MIFDGIHLSLPPGRFFNTPPDPDPLTLLPPLHEQTIRSPVPVDAELYHWTYSARLPFTFSIIYFSIVTIFNAINRRRGNKPTNVSKTSAFKAFVLLHNLALAIYSGLTCAALVRALYISVPGWLGPNGLPGTVDALCKMHGPGGYGNAVVYDPAKQKWRAHNSSVRLAAGTRLPDSTDEGRIWNEGLAFWGWLFYLSKYYEVVDTIIILLKGKRATTLQKYHHAGALLCMWAGMRYMSPPIWMFVLVNSGIHTLMYTFYTASTVGIRVPAAIKQSITTLQILQFLVGASFAAAHLFISYRVPVSTSYKVFSVASAIGKAGSSSVSGVASVLKPGAYNHKLPPWFKRLLYRATGAEGLADTVSDFGRDSALRQSNLQKPLSAPTKEYKRITTHFETVRCIDTSGEAFAVWLNVLYLAPLTLLFLRFFWKSYIIGRKKKTKQKQQPDIPPSPRRLSVSAIDAARQTSASFEEYGTEFEKSIGFGEDNEEAIIVTETIDSIEALPQDVRAVYEEIITSDERTAADIIDEIAQTLKSDEDAVESKEPLPQADDLPATPTKDVAEVPEAAEADESELVASTEKVFQSGLARSESKASTKSTKSRSSGISRIPSRVKKTFTEQDWFGGRSSSASSSTRKNRLSYVEQQEETISTSVDNSVSASQFSLWDDVKDETSHDQSQRAATYAEVTEHGEPLETDNAIENDRLEDLD